MSAVAAPLCVQLDQTKAVARERRALEESIQDAADLLKQKQQQIQTLLPGLANPSNEAAVAQLAAERSKLKELAARLQDARNALNTFNQQNPTREELQRREQQVAYEADLQKRKALRAQFAENLRKRCELLQELAQSEEQARTLQETAAREFPGFIGAVPSMDRYGAVQSQAGISDELVKCIPDHVFGGIHVVPGKTDWRAAAEPFLRAARQWLAATQTNSEVTEEE